MSERYIHIRNWDRYQHPDATRGKRPAPWIKDYTQQLGEDDFYALTFRQRGILQGLRLLYAANRGSGLGWNMAKIGRRLGEETVRSRDIEALNHAGFLVISASKSLAESSQDACLDVDVDVDVDKEKVLLPTPKKPAEKKKPGSVSPIRKPREADPLWDAMCAAFGAGEFTDSSRGVMNRAVGELRKVNATPQQVGDRKRAYEKKFPDIPCTPTALVKHWPYLNGASAAPRTAEERYRQEQQRREMQ